MMTTRTSLIIRISEDSIHWKPPEQAPDDVPFTACAWTGKGFVACGLGSDKRSTIYTSRDGNREGVHKNAMFPPDAVRPGERADSFMGMRQKAETMKG